jgi:hypothetical protein
MCLSSVGVKKEGRRAKPSRLKCWWRAGEGAGGGRGGGGIILLCGFVCVCVSVSVMMEEEECKLQCVVLFLRRLLLRGEVETL